MKSFKSFDEYAAYLREQDVAKAANLRRASALKGPKIGPKVAR